MAGTFTQSLLTGLTVERRAPHVLSRGTPYCVTNPDCPCGVPAERWCTFTSGFGSVNPSLAGGVTAGDTFWIIACTEGSPAATTPTATAGYDLVDSQVVTTTTANPFAGYLFRVSLFRRVMDGSETSVTVTADPADFILCSARMFEGSLSLLQSASLLVEHPQPAAASPTPYPLPLPQVTGSAGSRVLAGIFLYTNLVNTIAPSYTASCELSALGSTRFLLPNSYALPGGGLTRDQWVDVDVTVGIWHGGITFVYEIG